MKMLFVCLGNICRSPAAENIMNHKIELAGVGSTLQCDSAGTSSYHVGSAPDRRMSDCLRKRGYPIHGRSRQFSMNDLDEFDLILAMDRENYRDILRLDPKGKYYDKVKMMCDYATLFSDKDVPDPYYGGQSGFEHVANLLEDACDHLLTSLNL